MSESSILDFGLTIKKGSVDIPGRDGELRHAGRIGVQVQCSFRPE